MRVLHFFKTYWPDSFGGMERAIHAIACGTARLGVEPTVLSLSRDPARNSVSFDGHWAYKARLDLEVASTGFSLSAFKRFGELAEQADIIHYHFPWPFMDIVHFAVRPNRPVVVTYHSDIVRQNRLMRLYRPLMKRFLARADRIVASSPNYVATSDALQPYLGKIDVIPIGLNESDYPKSDQAARDKWRRRFPGKFFLFIGVFRYYKGLHILLEAARGFEYDIVLVGTGPMEQQLKEQASRLALSNVHFAGALGDAEKTALLDLCTGFVFPSHLRSEAYGLSLVEAAMAGKPMISCEIGTGTTFVNLHKETGLVVLPGSSDALASAMRHLAQDEAISRVYGMNARRRYDQLFRAESMCEAYFKLYCSVLEPARGR